MTTSAVRAQDRPHLRRALELAERGSGVVAPNPMVGAVIVRDGDVIGEGYHAGLGDLHAEVAALRDCRRRGHDPGGATMYVTLEPCAHHGRQPPCTSAIVAAGLARVVVASEDPSERASGRGPGILRDEGVEVVLAGGAEAAAARLLNQAFRKHARTGRPLAVLKLAMSLDGRIATTDGDSRWISSEASRELVHRWRAESDAVGIGIGTALADDPLLTARSPDARRQPLRVVFDSRARLPLDSALVRSQSEARLLVVAGPGAGAEEGTDDRVRALERIGVEVLRCPGAERHCPAAALEELGRRGITSLMLEGGAGLAASFRGELDELRLFYAPILLGEGARAALGGPGPARVADAERALAVDHERVGEDLLVRARLREW